MTAALNGIAIHITAESALRYLLAAVKEKGVNYIYEWDETSLAGECHYTRRGKCACIVGNALNKAGVTIPELAEMDKDVKATVMLVPLPGHVTIDEHALDILRDAQVPQDLGAQWGVALHDAIRTADYLGYTAVAAEVQAALDELRAVKP